MTAWKNENQCLTIVFAFSCGLAVMMIFLSGNQILNMTGRILGISLYFINFVYFDQTRDSRPDLQPLRVGQHYL